VPFFIAFFLAPANAETAVSFARLARRLAAEQAALSACCGERPCRAIIPTFVPTGSVSMRHYLGALCGIGGGAVGHCPGPAPAALGADVPRCRYWWPA